jgi:hypothetical protein
MVNRLVLIGMGNKAIREFWIYYSLWGHSMDKSAKHGFFNIDKLG